ncbi:MAG: family 10 glycosylhydrolase [Armatimonadetes bacterium]|nr:family 10 glycosylhydrolase [Armatimonadota bacterium]
MALRKSLLAAICIFALLIGLCVSVGADELRGAWVTSWTRGFFTPQEIDATVSAAKKAGINALFIEVRKFADAYYDSKIEPRGDGMAPDFDALAYTLKKAHAEGIQVHAWVVVYRAWCGAKTGPKDPKHIINKHPDWVLLSKDGKNWAGEGIYLDPGVPAAREYIVSVFEDIAKRYNVDGIHYDYVRYPGNQWGYSDAALKQYYADTGAKAKPAVDDPKWLQWKRDQVTALVKLSKEKIKAANPKIAISAATICWGGVPNDFTKTSPYVSVSQDWRMWMEKGLIDINIPMNYKTEDKYGKAFRLWADAAGKWSAGGLVYQGLGAEYQSPENIVTQIKYCRSIGQKGFLLFSFNQGKRRDALVPVLGAALGPAPKLTINAIDYKVEARRTYGRGIDLAVASKTDEAIAQFKKAIDFDPEYADAHFRLGRCYLKVKDYPAAKASFLKTLELDPTYESAKKELDLLDQQT